MLLVSGSLQAGSSVEGAIRNGGYGFRAADGGRTDHVIDFIRTLVFRTFFFLSKRSCFIGAGGAGGLCVVSNAGRAGTLVK